MPRALTVRYLTGDSKGRKPEMDRRSYPPDPFTVSGRVWTATGVGNKGDNQWQKSNGDL